MTIDKKPRLPPTYTYPEEGILPTLVEHAVVGEKITFTAAPLDTPEKHHHYYEWFVYCDQPGTDKEYVINSYVNPSTDTALKGENAYSIVEFKTAHDWTVKVRISGGFEDKKEFLGEYSAVVKVRSLRINPVEIKDGKLGKEYTFVAEILGSELPEGETIYKWVIDEEKGTFWDTSFETTTNRMTYAFQEGGNYNVSVTLHFLGKEMKSQSSVAIADIGLVLNTPDETSFIANKDYTFTAASLNPQYLPKDPVYKWDFGDGTGLVIPLSNESTHAFTDGGHYTIKVDVCDSESDDAPVLDSATAKLFIEPSEEHLIELHQMNKFELDFAVQHNYVEGMSSVFRWDWDSYGEVLWDGVNFSMDWAQYNHSERMTGTVSKDGTKILQLKIRHEFKGSAGTEWYEIEIQDLPFWQDLIPDRFEVDISGEEVKNYVVFFNTYRTSGFQWNNDSHLRIQFKR